MRAKVNGQYLTKALTLDRECFSSESDVEARPILRKLRSCPKSGGRAWAPSRDAARTSICCCGRRQGPRPCATGAQLEPHPLRRLSRLILGRYRRHWGAELALQGARLRFSRAYLAFQAPSCQAGMTFGTSSIGFDPDDSALYAAEA